MSIANLTHTELTLQTRLNNQSQYDLVSAIWRGPSGEIFINLSAPYASADGHASSVLSRQQPSISSHRAAQSSRGQLAKVTIGQNNSRNSGPLPPSGASVSTHLRNADGLGASSNRIAAQPQAARRPRLGAEHLQIEARLRNPDGSLRTQRAVVRALHAAGLGAGESRIRAQLHAAGGARHLPSATDAQINAHLHNPDGSLRTHRGVASALRAAGWGAGHARITTLRQDALGPQ